MNKKHKLTLLTIIAVTAAVLAAAITTSTVIVNCGVPASVLTAVAALVVVGGLIWAARA